MRNSLIFTLLLIFCCSFGPAFSQTNHQYYFKRNFNLAVYDSLNNVLPLAWLGGLNSCQLDMVDLDLDGNDDLIVFDRNGNKIHPFRNTGAAGSFPYEYKAEWINKFPPIHDWLIFRDYNHDGKKDIFTYAAGGISVYINKSTSSNIGFTLLTFLLNSFQSSGYVNLYLTDVDYPGIADIDGDGDLDILTFFGLGSYIEFHSNQSMEKYGHPDTLDLKRVNLCWGNFFESELSNLLTLNAPCSKQYYMGNTEEGGSRHVGSTMQLLDLNNDGVLDMLLGDVDYPNLIQLINGGTPDSAHMISQDISFPSNTTPVNLFSLPVPCYNDFDNDGVNELVVSPFDPNPFIPQKFNSVWFYENTGSNTNPNFSYTQSNYIQEWMIDVGGGAYPVFFDYNGDGLKDLFIGNYGYLDSSYYEFGFLKSIHRAQIALFKNTGTQTQASFKLITRDFGGIGNLKLVDVCPTFGDIDGDGDADMITGDTDGTLHFFENTSGTNQSIQLGTHIVNYQSIDVGKISTPYLIDLDRDNLLDLVIGEKSGNLNYYRNTGSANNPVFTLITDSLGKVNVTDYFLTNFGHSVPSFFEDTLGKYKMVSGSEMGYVFLYDQIEGNLTGQFNALDTLLNYIDAGIRSTAAVTDINNDGFMDLFVGNISGGLEFYLGDTTGTGINETFIVESNWSVFPNPTREVINIQFDNQYPKNATVSLINLEGQCVLKKEYKGKNQLTLPVSSVKDGFYLIRLIFEKENGIIESSSRKVIIRKN